MGVDEWRGERSAQSTGVWCTGQAGAAHTPQTAAMGQCLRSALRQPDVSSPSPSVTSPVKYFKDNGHLVIHSENTDFAEAAEEGCKRSFVPWSEKR